jgi:hypothetical protein
MAEQLTLNQWVEGSSPPRLTTFDPCLCLDRDGYKKLSIQSMSVVSTTLLQIMIWISVEGSSPLRLQENRYQKGLQSQDLELFCWKAQRSD